MKTLCLGCMEEYEGQGRFCPRCGYDQTLPPAESHHLNPGTVIRNRYKVGRVLGSGGFGITYIAYDLTLLKKIAVKEYLPMEFATRIPNQTRVSVYKGEKQEQFEAGMHKSLDEAKRLAEFQQTPGITQIYDFFEANNTAYIVMELLEGETLKDRLRRTGVMPVEEALPIILAVTGALKAVHAKHIIHRDIAPDNIYLLNTGEVKLLDFGASRQVTTTNSKSLTVILKAGYAPVEQYQSGGYQGPWTDIYALAATFYKMITGKKPPDSWDRRTRDTLQEPSALGVVIDKNLENALMNALQVRVENRTKSAEEFEAALRASHVERVRPQEERQEVESLKWPLWMKAVFGVAGILLIAGVVILASGVIKPDSDRPMSGIGVEVLEDGYVWVPNLLNLSQEAAKTRAEDAGLAFQIAGTEPSDTILKGYVVRQQDENGNDLARGEQIEEGSRILVIVSSGNGKAEIPDIRYMRQDVALEELKKLDLTAVNVETADGFWASEGTVMDVSPAVGEEVTQDTVITVMVSSGGTNAENGKADIPDLLGLDQDTAWELLKSAGLYMEKTVIEYQADTKIGEILRQDPSPGESGNRGDIITVVVSAGPKAVQLADLTGFSEDEAREQLKSLGLIAGESILEYDESVPGTVVAQSVDPGIVSEGDTIVLTVSQGPVPAETAPTAAERGSAGGSGSSGGRVTQPAAETSAPTTAPETAVPETAAPETAAPETTAPETTAPETVPPGADDQKYNIW